jgi:hypothetical protein
MKHLRTLIFIFARAACAEAENSSDIQEEGADVEEQEADSVQPPPDQELRKCGSEVAPCITCESSNSDCSASPVGQKQTWMSACNNEWPAEGICVECIAGDSFNRCQSNTFSLGPVCVDGFCGCDDGEGESCVSNINGGLCLSTGGKSYCGCESEKDCRSDFPCIDNPYVGGKTCKNAVWPD